MTVQERLQYTQKLRRALRDDEIRVGVRRPRTMRECLRADDSSSFDRVRRVARRSRSLNQFMDMSSIKTASCASGAGRQ
jgi:hypothetical protein